MADRQETGHVVPGLKMRRPRPSFFSQRPNVYLVIRSLEQPWFNARTFGTSVGIGWHAAPQKEQPWLV